VIAVKFEKYLDIVYAQAFQSHVAVYTKNVFRKPVNTLIEHMATVEAVYMGFGGA
jgi:hypothetical protein